MAKALVFIKELLDRNISIEHIKKTTIKRTPGAVTDDSRN